MSTKEELIVENELLKRKLALAEAWMRREVVNHKKNIAGESIKSTKRKQLDNMFERESVDIITRRIKNYFGESLENAPKFTINHLIDSEIYWQTLQKFPSLDALPVVSSYQKILEGFFEKIVLGFREYVKLNHSINSDRKLSGKGKFETVSTQGGFDRDIENIIEKKYSLSLGRWYQFFERVRAGGEFGGYFEDLFLEYMSTAYEGLLEMCIIDPFFSGFAQVINLEVFGKKRHDAKVTYSDAQKVRELCIGNDKKKSILLLVMRNISSDFHKKNESQ